MHQFYCNIIIQSLKNGTIVTRSLSKKDVVKILEEIGTLLELKGENPFKSRAYYTAARNIESVDEDFQSLVDGGALSTIKGIGKALNQKITELVTTGHLAYYDELKASIPSGLIDMLRIQGLGPKKIGILHEKLNIETIGELEYACIENRLVELPGFGKKTQDKILTGIEHLKIYSERHLYANIINEAHYVLNQIKEHEQVIAASLAGSIRRCNEIIKDIDIVVSTDHPTNVADFLTTLPLVDSIIGKGDTKVSVTLESGIQVDVRLVTPEQFPSALHHFTGSKEHNIAMRARAKAMGFKINEYGLFDSSGIIVCNNEGEIFSTLGLAYIPPELRENMGEIEAAEKNEIPRLIEYYDIKGLIHIHSNASDGSSSIESLVQAAKEMGMDYIGISDHSETAFYAGGLSFEDIKKQHALIDRMNERDTKFHIFKGIEAEILSDGTLDYDDHTLRSFDFVIAAVHSHFRMSEEQMTERIMKALDNPFTTMLAHPTGRLLLAREPYAINLPRIIDRAAQTGTIIELNANPHRLDLDWRFCNYATKRGVKIAVNPDAHSIEGLRDIQFGINIARKGWVTPSNCINCLNLEEIKKLFSLSS
jgi:DNA polymerase (family 10)